jgi:TolB-like protein/DNA-binding winged helix-turn-helix (wHTH) protein/Flp pilus assembly protein TadD
MAESSRQCRVVRFGLYEARLDTGELLKNGSRVKLQERPFQILTIFLERPGEIVTREEFRRRLWSADTFVDFDHSLNTSITKLRQALDDDADNPRFVATAGRRGYRFIAPVAAPPDPTLAGTAETEQPIVGSGGAERDSQAPSTARTESRRRVPTIGVALIVLALATASAAWRYTHRRVQMPLGRIMLAVLPFENLTGDPEQEYFADGLTDELITQLGRLRPDRLGVIARTSVMDYKRRTERIDQIGRELSVQYVLEGSVRRAKDHLRITAQLISVADQTHLWAQGYDLKPHDVLAVQDEVAVAVAQEIQVQLSPRQRTDLSRGRTAIPEANEAYLKGRYFWNKRTGEALRKSADYFEAAIAKDPRYARAYAGLADAYVLLGGYGVIPQKDAMPRAKAAAQKALAIDDTLAEAYTSLGLVVEEYEWNWPDVEKDYKRAIELNPNYSVAHHFYADGYLAAVGRREEAIAELRKAHELDPLSLVIASDLARHLGAAHRYSEAIEQLHKVLEVDPDFVLAHDYLSKVYEEEGRLSEAIAEIEKIRMTDRAPYIWMQLADVYVLAGRKREATEIVDQLQQASKETYVDPWTIAYVYAALREKDLTLLWLQKAYELRSPGILGLKDSHWETVRGDARFQDLLHRIGLAEDEPSGPIAIGQRPPESK